MDAQKGRASVRDAAVRTVYGWARVFTLLLCAGTLLFGLWLRVFRVSGISMQPTLVTGDAVLINSLNDRPQAGDVAVIHSDIEGTGSIVKRVIAVEGQTVDVDYGRGVVTVRGGTLEMPVVFTVEGLARNTDDEVRYPYTVPAGSIFVMGDNTPGSLDSRARRIGAVDRRFVIGTVLLRAGAGGFGPVGDDSFRKSWIQ